MSAPTAAELRGLFMLDPDVVFLNHGSFGACPRPVFEAYQHWQRELEREPVDFIARRRQGLLSEARGRLAAYVGAGRDDLVFVPNATHGVNIVARSLRLEPGDEVLATSHEYGACDRAWQFACARSGASYVRASAGLPSTTPEDLADEIWSAVTERTKVLFVSHLTSQTAIVMPVEELVRRAREAGIITLVDGAHAPGQIPLDLSALGADFYTGNCHKWICSPKGSAFLHARPEAQILLEPLVVSWGTIPHRPGPSRFVDELEYTGTHDVAAYLAVPAALDFLAEHDWPAVAARCRDLARWARTRLLAVPGVTGIVPDDPGWVRQMAAVRLPACDDPVGLSERLFAEWGVEVPAYFWGDVPLLRVAIQGYNAASDVEALVDALAAVLGVSAEAGEAPAEVPAEVRADALADVPAEAPAAPAEASGNAPAKAGGPGAEPAGMGSSVVARVVPNADLSTGPRPVVGGAVDG